MNIISLIILLVVFSLILVGVFWIGFYIVLPLILFAALISFGASLIKNFMSKLGQKPSENLKKVHQNQVIDVEFEEVKE